LTLAAMLNGSALSVDSAPTWIANDPSCMQAPLGPTYGRHDLSSLQLRAASRSAHEPPSFQVTKRPADSAASDTSMGKTTRLSRPVDVRAAEGVSSPRFPLPILARASSAASLGKRILVVGEGDRLSKVPFRGEDDYSNLTASRNFFHLGNHVDPEAYKPQIAIQNNKCTHRRRWYRLHKAIVEFSVYSAAHVIVELLLNGETARVLSTWDLEGVRSFLEVGSMAAPPISRFSGTRPPCLCGAQGHESEPRIATSDKAGLRSLVSARIVSPHDVQDALSLSSRAMLLEELPKVRRTLAPPPAPLARPATPSVVMAPPTHPPTHPSH
jgi:hypothetical protein